MSPDPSNLRWNILDDSQGLTKDKMFDLDLYQTHVDEEKRIEFADKIKADPYLKYIVNAIEHAANLK